MQADPASNRLLPLESPPRPYNINMGKMELTDKGIHIILKMSTTGKLSMASARKGKRHFHEA